MLDRIKKKGAYQASNTSTRGGASLHRPGRRRRWQALAPDARRLHLRFASLAWRDSGQEPVGNCQAGRCRAGDHDHLTTTATRSRSSRRSTATPAASRGWPRLRPLWHAGRDLWAGAMPASTAVWAAPCTLSSRPSASCPTTPSSAARPTSPPAPRSFKRANRRPASSSPTLATRPWAADRCGKR